MYIKLISGEVRSLFVSVSLYSNCSVTVARNRTWDFAPKLPGVLGGDGFQTEGDYQKRKKF